MLCVNCYYCYYTDMGSELSNFVITNCKNQEQQFNYKIFYQYSEGTRNWSSCFIIPNNNTWGRDTICMININICKYVIKRNYNLLSLYFCSSAVTLQFVSQVQQFLTLSRYIFIYPPSKTISEELVNEYNFFKKQIKNENKLTCQAYVFLILTQLNQFDSNL